MSTPPNPQPSTLNPQPSIKTGIFGGSFNPVHIGHTSLAAYICEQGLVDEVWMMVSPQNPLKQNLELLDEKERLHMVQLAVAPYPKLKACDFEFHLPRPSYTYHTLQALREAYPDREFALIIGEDNWTYFDRWYRHEDIARETPIIVYPRDSVEGIRLRVEGAKFRVESLELREPSGRVHITEHPQPSTTLANHPPLRGTERVQLFPYSSTEVRNAIAGGKDTSTMLHPDVEAYIKERKLYR